MKKKPLEADLDPRGTRHSRPGGKAAESAIANSKAGVKPRRTASAPSRPGSTAAARAVAASKGKGRGK